ncbi:hypothetical protein AFL01nite_02630 [Aeromicrobium flavum]|uniref:site-specific DNA-methyltransferase (adenine-specific) n=1 Tax=Aeromicrobium flavum TaxID=416568 RepID=A0A512HR72_9ACTN|nr:hypothetical protein [Aeromicrobium flavum]GEO87936.1 hypothetical protein AFL01nite_02630 [Aeromicrobium flavum]
MKSLEQRLLGRADQLLDEAAAEVCPDADRSDARLTVLESAAANLGGWTIEEFYTTVGREPSDMQADPAPWADKLLTTVAETPIPAPLALSALSREALTENLQRKTGAYYTDWRLAEFLAGSSVPTVKADGPWVDAACGSGVLLTAAAMQVPAGERRDLIIRDKLVGADLSRRALRGALLSVASLTSDLTAISGFAGRLLLQDSLRSPGVWEKVAPAGAGLVIGNPPWEKLKASRHELAKSQGLVRSYGQSFETSIDLETQRSTLLAYVEQVASGTRLQGGGEHDLYKLFLELGMGISAEDGVLALLLPAGLVRAKGTESLRRELEALAPELSIAVIENRAGHFAIDTRFKFLAIVARIGSGRRRPIRLKVADRSGVLPSSPVELSRAQLREVRRDLSIPEVRTKDEWDLFMRLSKSATTVGDPDGPWRPEYRREIDMTRDRKSFQNTPSDETIPLLEGRHVAQYRWRAKTFCSGEGRSAIWRPEPLEDASFRTQWHVPLSALHAATIERTMRSRIGFCDITGQTNERSLLTARVPAGVVCGNKVPTLVFSTGGEAREDLFLALTNSLVVDWMLRRIVTTTVNYFLLDTLPLPRIDEDEHVGQELVQLARQLTRAEGDVSIDRWEVGQWRARLDALVAAAWGLDCSDLETVLRDFPLLDRGQPPLMGETRSTVTADCALAELAEILGIAHPSAKRRENAHDEGAVPYVPAEYARRNP